MHAGKIQLRERFTGGGYRIDTVAKTSMPVTTVAAQREQKPVLPRQHPYSGAKRELFRRSRCSLRTGNTRKLRERFEICR